MCCCRAVALCLNWCGGHAKIIYLQSRPPRKYAMFVLRPAAAAGQPMNLTFLREERLDLAAGSQKQCFPKMIEQLDEAECNIVLYNFHYTYKVGGMKTYSQPLLSCLTPDGCAHCEDAVSWAHQEGTRRQLVTKSMSLKQITSRGSLQVIAQHIQESCDILAIGTLEGQDVCGRN